MGGCTFDVRNPFLGPLMPFGGAGDLPLHPLLAGSPAVDGAVGDLTRDDQRDGWVDGIDPPMPAAWTIFEPLVDGDGDGTAVRDLGPYERSDRWQTELLAVRAHGPASHSVVTIPSGYDRGAGTVYDATSAANEFVTYALPIAEPGRYDVSIGARTGPDAGKFQVAIADDPAGPWTAVGPEQDGYAAPAGFVVAGTIRGAGRDGRREAGALHGDGQERRQHRLSHDPRFHPGQEEPDSLPGLGPLGRQQSHLCADERRRRALLGRQRQRPARRRRRRRSGAPARGRCLGRDRDRQRRGAHLRAFLGRKRALLGRQRQRPARRRLHDGARDAAQRAACSRA